MTDEEGCLKYVHTTLFLVLSKLSKQGTYFLEDEVEEQCDTIFSDS